MGSRACAIDSSRLPGASGASGGRSRGSGVRLIACPSFRFRGGGGAARARGSGRRPAGPPPAPAPAGEEKGKPIPKVAAPRPRPGKATRVDASPGPGGAAGGATGRRSTPSPTRKTLRSRTGGRSRRRNAFPASVPFPGTTGSRSRRQGRASSPIIASHRSARGRRRASAVAGARGKSRPLSSGERSGDAPASSPP